ncbi:MAG: flagellar basal body rod protein FlgB [Rhizobiaceae bacterium]
MQPVNLFDLATQQARWLSVRQSAVAGNIANANTPGYTAVDVEPFEKVLDNTRVAMGATQSGHLMSGVTQASIAVRPDDIGDAAVLPTGNRVVLESELMKAGEIRREFELNTAIVKSFHRMMMMVTRA